MLEKDLVANGDQTKINDLLREIREIWTQYKEEVPKKRRPWPRSIKERIIELWKLKVSSHTIGLETGLAIQTMYSMRQRLKQSDPEFLPVPLVRRRRKSLALTDQSLQLSQSEVPKNSPISVIVREDLRIELPTVEAAAKLLRLLEV